MRTVVHSSEVPHLWAHKAQPTARSAGNGNLYFSGDIIFSYGSHFPIARHVENRRGRAILFTSQDYSVTTSRHKQMVRAAINGQTVFTVPNVPYLESLNRVHSDNLKSYAEAIVKHATKAKRARSSWNKEYHTKVMQTAVTEGNAYMKFFAIRRKPFVLPTDTDVAKLLADAKTAAAREKVEQAKREARQAKEMEEQRAKARELLESWRQGGSVESWQLSYADETALRIEGEEIVTSKGARVPLSHAIRILPAVRSGVPYQHNGHSIHLGHYRIDSIDAEGNLRAGCHYIKRTEIERIAAQLGL